MFTLPSLPYDYNALEPIIDAQTVELHYSKHHQGYVNKLNELIADTGFKDRELEEIIKTADGPIFNNASQIWNHTFYRNCLQSPQENNQPTWSLLEAINANRWSFEKFKEVMTASAVGNFWSGRTWLVKNPDGTLEIINTSNAWSPLTLDKKPLLTVDVWEHAYYLKYQNRRVEYVTNRWNIVNRDFVEKELEA